MENKKYYFISDAHLGLYPPEKSLEREKKLVRWLEQIEDDVDELYMLGDIFDFWHEYKYVIPKGFSRFLGQLVRMADKGVKMHFFSGNHDVWTYNYLHDEMGIELYHEPVTHVLNGKKFFLGHGDGLGPGDMGYKLLIRIFRNPFLQWCFARLHPNLALWFVTSWSKSSRYSKGIVAEEFAGFENESQILFARDYLKKEAIDYFIFGHRHIPSVIQLPQSATYVNLGDWIYSFTYGVLEGGTFELRQFEGDGANILRRTIE